MRRVPTQRPNSTIKRERDRQTLLHLSVVLLCGLTLACGFVRATAQHVSAIRYGYQSEELRRERARLLEQQRKLSLALDEAAAPAKLERAAREIGLEPARAAQVRIIKANESDAARTPESQMRASSAASRQ
ncbi:MAG: hypothetical protein H0V88_10120 [Pyrinomonadaceae bacterium]|nr:hypothetical protein [Pyrinomonadaceae bacterium]